MWHDGSSILIMKLFLLLLLILEMFTWAARSTTNQDQVLLPLIDVGSNMTLQSFRYCYRISRPMNLHTEESPRWWVYEHSCVCLLHLLRATVRVLTLSYRWRRCSCISNQKEPEHRQRLFGDNWTSVSLRFHFQFIYAQRDIRVFSSIDRSIWTDRWPDE